jgi:hypothetical protein
MRNAKFRVNYTELLASCRKLRATRKELNIKSRGTPRKLCGHQHKKREA